MAVERIKYQAGNVTAHGALVWNDKISTKRPLLLVMSNWLGVTDTIIKRAEKMAGDKYIAFVGCMYGEGKTAEGPPESQELMMAVRADRVEGRKRVNAALQAMISEADKHGIGDSSKKAAVGFCFGGGNVLELARSGADLDAVVCLHGDLATTMPAKKGDIKAAIFVLHGSKDPISGQADRNALADADLRRTPAFLRGRRDRHAGRGEVRCRRRAPDLSDARRFHPGCVREAALVLHDEAKRRSVTQASVHFGLLRSGVIGR